LPAVFFDEAESGASGGEEAGGVKNEVGGPVGVAALGLDEEGALHAEGESGRLRQGGLLHFEMAGPLAETVEIDGKPLISAPKHPACRGTREVGGLHQARRGQLDGALLPVPVSEQDKVRLAGALEGNLINGAVHF
jgi:hypothetical protein